MKRKQALLVPSLAEALFNQSTDQDPYTRHFLRQSQAHSKRVICNSESHDNIVRRTWLASRTITFQRAALAARS